MKIATGLPNAIPGRAPDLAPRWAQRAEAAGFSALGTIGRSVFDSDEELVALAAAAGATTRIGLATTVLIGPVRDAVLLAKQAATLDNLSGGRLLLGLGAGWRDDDFRAHGRPFDRRGPALEAQIRTLRQVWAGEPPDPALGPVGPLPARAGGPPVALGGMAEPALRRAGRLADVYLAPPVPAAEVTRLYALVCAGAADAGRPAPALRGAAYCVVGGADEAAEAYMRAYYAAGGEAFVEQMLGALKRTPAAIRTYIAELEAAGVEDVFLWPTVAALDQIDRLADAVL